MSTYCAPGPRLGAWENKMQSDYNTDVPNYFSSKTLSGRLDLSLNPKYTSSLRKCLIQKITMLPQTQGEAKTFANVVLATHTLQPILKR